VTREVLQSAVARTVASVDSIPKRQIDSIQLTGHRRVQQRRNQRPGSMVPNIVPSGQRQRYRLKYHHPKANRGACLRKETSGGGDGPAQCKPVTSKPPSPLRVKSRPSIT